MPSYGIIEKVDDVTRIVLRAMAGAPNAPLREVMGAFIRHLHALEYSLCMQPGEAKRPIPRSNRRRGYVKLT